MLDHSIYPETTLFMLMSVDGKISTGLGNSFDVDKDFPKISGLKEGLQQYYDLEQETDLWSLVTGKTMAKIGANSGKLYLAKVPNLHRVILGIRELNLTGARLLANQTDKIHFICKDENECALIKKSLNGYDNYTVNAFTNYKNPLSYLKFLKSIGCNELTVQSGGTVNGAFLNNHAFDHIHIVVAPALIGGKNTPTLIDGPDHISGLDHINVMKLRYAKVLSNSYLDLFYDVR